MVEYRVTECKKSVSRRKRSAGSNAAQMFNRMTENYVLIWQKRDLWGLWYFSNYRDKSSIAVVEGGIRGEERQHFQGVLLWKGVEN